MANDIDRFDASTMLFMELGNWGCAYNVEVCGVCFSTDIYRKALPYGKAYEHMYKRINVSI